MKKKHVKKTSPEININKNKILEKLYPIIENAGKELNLIIIEASFTKEQNNYFLRIFIFNQERPINHDDCANLTRLLGEQIEELGIIEVPYNLEVSSPGVTRKLKNPIEYEIFKGKDVKIVLKKPLPESNTNKLYTGILMGLTEDKNNVIIKIENTEKTINLDIIKTIQLKYKEKQSD